MVLEISVWTNRQSIGQTDKQTDKQTDRLITILCSLVYEARVRTRFICTVANAM